MTYQEILDYLAVHWRKTTLTAPVASYDFAALESVLAAFGHPEAGLRYLHVTGSKGKGSAAYLASHLLARHGVRVGLFTGPHLSHVEERISVDGRVIPRAAFATELAAALDARARLAPHLGVFPMLLVAALTWFRAQGVQVAVIEVRSGGRYDPTNVIPARHQAITAIEGEHMPGLGRTLAEVADQKAGIIKPGSTVTVDAQPSEVRAVVEGAAAQVGARLRLAGCDFEACPIDFAPSGSRFRYRTPAGVTGRGPLSLLGRHQVANAAIAIATVEAILAELGQALDPARVALALSTAAWPARLEKLRDEPLTLYDAAHTPRAARCLAEALPAHFGAGRWQIVLCLLRSKDAGAILRELAPVAGRVLTVPVPGFAAYDPETLVERAADAGIPAEAWPSVAEALREAEQWSDPMVVSGTLYLYDATRAALESDRELRDAW